MADETFEVQIIADTQEAIRNIQQMQAQIISTRKQLLDLAQQTQAAFTDVAKSMKSTKWNELMKDFKVKKFDVDKDKFVIDKDAMAQARAEYKKYAESVSSALRQISQDEKTIAKERSAIEKQLAQEKIREEKFAAAQIRADYKQQVIDAQNLAKERERASKEASKQKMQEEKQAASELVKFERGLQSSLSDIDKKRLAESLQLSKQRAAADKEAAKSVLSQQKASAAEQENFERKLAATLKSIDQDAAKESERLAKQKATALKKEAQEVLKAQQSSGGLAGAFSKLGATAKYVFGTVLGLSAVGAVQQLGQAFVGAIKGGVEFADAMYRLGASTRALQRTGMNITIAEVVQQVKDLRAQFAFLSQKEAVQGISSIQMLTRSFQFTQDQMKQTTQAAIVLSTVTGKDFGETARELSLFLSSGYAESLQKAGLAVNRLTVAEKAAQMGYKGGYTALSEEERAAAGLAVVMEELGPLLGEIENYQKSLAGQIDITNAAIEDQTNLVALKLAPLQKIWLDFKLVAVNALLSVADAMIWFASNDVSAMLWTALVSPMIVAVSVIQAYRDGVELTFDDIKRIFHESNKMTYDAIREQGESLRNTIDIYQQAGSDVPGSEFGSMPILSNEDADKQVETIKSMYEDALKLQRDYERDFAEAGRELQDDMGTFDPEILDGIVASWDRYFSNVDEITVDGVEAMQARMESGIGEFGDIVDEGLDKALEIWQDYYDKLDDIARKEQQSIEDEAVDYANAIEDANREANQSIEDANRKHREEELKAERDYQEKLRRLKEEYLFNLEDALRERDALQVLRLMRKYEMDKAQIEREKDLEDQARDEAFQRELADIELQRQRKLEELAIEHQRKLEEIRLQAERERAEAERNREQAMEQLKVDMERERAERQIKYAQEIEDLKTRFKDRLTEIFIGLTDEEGMTSEMLDQIGALYLSMFGQDGVVDMSYQYLQGIIEGAVAESQAALTAVQEMALQAQQTADMIAAMQSAQPTNMNQTSPIQQANQGVGTPTTPGWSDAGASHALGGMEYVNKPTWALFGEAGPEIATFTPINRLNTNNLGLPNPFNGSGGNANQGGKMSVLIRLSPGLMGEIVDQSLNSFAQIIEER